jgi:hypothetical protein
MRTVTVRRIAALLGRFQLYTAPAPPVPATSGGRPPLVPTHADELVFHEHKREATEEKIAEEKVELVRLAPFPLPLGEHDPADARIARARDAKTGRHRLQAARCLCVGKAEGIDDAQGKDELAVHGRMEGHRPRMGQEGMCV